jgi:hypothetical protein
MTTITLTSRELTALVAPVLPHASMDVTIPTLMSILIRSTGPWVTAIATDRYRIGMQRLRPDTEPGDGFMAAIPLRALARIRSLFKATRYNDPVLTFTVDDGTIVVTAVDTLIGLTGASLSFDVVKDYPKIDRLMVEALNAPPVETASRAVINPALLADFAVGQPSHIPAHITPTGPDNKPWMIRIGDDFIGLVVPIHGGSPLVDATTWLPLLTVAPTEPVAAAA